MKYKVLKMIISATGGNIWDVFQKKLENKLRIIDYKNAVTIFAYFSSYTIDYYCLSEKIIPILNLLINNPKLLDVKIQFRFGFNYFDNEPSYNKNFLPELFTRAGFSDVSKYHTLELETGEIRGMNYSAYFHGKVVNILNNLNYHVKCISIVAYPLLDGIKPEFDYFSKDGWSSIPLNEWIPIAGMLGSMNFTRSSMTKFYEIMQILEGESDIFELQDEIMHFSASDDYEHVFRKKYL